MTVIVSGEAGRGWQGSSVYRLYLAARLHVGELLVVNTLIHRHGPSPLGRVLIA